MKLGFIYAGQGSQRVGMGLDFYEKEPLFREVLDSASGYVKDVTDFDVKACCFEGPAEMLGQTQYTQPCMVAYAVGVTKLLKREGITPDYVCGLSLGEYSALYAAGVLDEETVLNLVAFRGKVMAEAVTGREVKMSAVMMMDREVIADCCRRAEEQLAGENLVVQVANYNCPGQIVISGDGKGVELASELLKEQGAKRIIPLKVSGPFHTSLMKPAGDLLKERFRKVNFKKPEAEILFNATGKPMQEGESFESLLERQVQSSVYLEDSIRCLQEAGVDHIVEIGPGSTISKFVKKTAPDMTVYSIDTIEDFQKVVEALTKKGAKDE